MKKSRNSTMISHSKCWRCGVTLEQDLKSIWTDTCCDCYFDVVEYKFEQEIAREEDSDGSLVS